MHYLVRLIVEAENAEEAKAEADRVMEDLLDWHEFDWYNIPTDESRWENCWVPEKVSSKKGAAWIEDAMAGQLKDFKRTLQSVRHMVENYSDEQIFEEQFEQVDGMYLSRWQFRQASGGDCQLFDHNGSTITNQHYLDMILKDTENLWVVQVDAHN